MTSAREEMQSISCQRRLAAIEASSVAAGAAVFCGRGYCLLIFRERRVK
jgi:hypothetical protein